jgi:hypothetical protein
MSVPEIMTALGNDQFSTEAGILMVKILMRHGAITPENEPEYHQMAWRMQRNLDQSMKDAVGQRVPAL